MGTHDGMGVFSELVLEVRHGQRDGEKVDGVASPREPAVVDSVRVVGAGQEECMPDQHRSRRGRRGNWGARRAKEEIGTYPDQK